MGRYIRALGHVAKVAQVTLVDDLDVVCFVYPVDFHSVRFVDQVKQRGKRVAQTDTAPTAVTDVIDPFQFLLEIRLIPVLV
jgi:hypothetical protein